VHPTAVALRAAGVALTTAEALIYLLAVHAGLTVAPVKSHGTPEQQARLLRSELPGLAGQVEAEVEAEAPAAVATLFAEAIARQLRSRR